MLHADTSSKRLIGIMIASLATICFAALDTSGKWLVGHFVLIQVVWVRFAGQVLIAFLVLIKDRDWRTFWVEDQRFQIIRAFMLTAMTALNFGALQYLQLAQTSSILFSTPILIALITHYVNHERITLPQWLAILSGFVGILIILDPFGHRFHPAMLLVLAHATIFAAFNFLTRKMAASTPPTITQFYSALGPTIVMLPLVIWQWRSPQGHIEWLVIFCAGFFGFASHYLLAFAYRFAKPSTISPFFYQQMLYMILLGWWVFDQTPHWNVIAGTIFVIGSGLYLLIQEMRQEKNDTP